MNYLNLTVLLEGMVALGDMEGFLGSSLSLTEESAQGLFTIVTTLEEVLTKMELRTSARGAERLVRVLNQRPLPPSQYICQTINTLVVTVKDEIHDVVAYQVASRKVNYLHPEPFGPEVHSRFRSASYDIEEAGKCLAFGRSTACVLHLMRVLEAGLDALKLELGIADYCPTWKVALDQILKAVSAKPEKEKTSEERSRDGFIRDCVRYLSTYKDSIRNPAMHKVEKCYDEEQAREVWDAVRAFMRHLASRLSDAPVG